MDNKTMSAEWFEYADRDLASAKHLQSMKPVPIEVICYHCQQSAEKYIKGLIILSGKAVRKTHDLLILLDELDGLEDLKSEITGACGALTNYGVVVRYPFHVDLTYQEMRDAIVNAEAIREKVLKLCQT